MKTESFAAYVKAIHAFPDGPGLVLESEQRTRWPDQGFEVVRDARIIEQDDFPSEFACAELQ